MAWRTTWTAALFAVWALPAQPQQILPGPGSPGRRPFPPGIGKIAGPRQNLIEHLMSLSPQEQQNFMRQDPRFLRLPPWQKQVIQQRLDAFNHLPPARREALRERYELFRQLSPERQDRARSLYRQWSEQPPERRLELRKELRRLRESTPEERKVRMESEAFQKRFSGEERDLLKGLAELLPEPEG